MQLSIEETHVANDALSSINHWEKQNNKDSLKFQHEIIVSTIICM